MSDVDHVTTQILQAAADRLAPIVGTELGSGTVKAVHISRVWPTDLRDLPALNVFVPDEAISNRKGMPGQRMQRRGIRLQIIIPLRRPASPVNTLEADIGRLKVLIEGALGNDPILRDPEGEPLNTDLFLTATGSGLDPQSAGLQLVLLWLNFSAVARHREGDPAHPMNRAP
ncbi:MULTISPECIES: hypothetical protein [Methylobacterium]|uniref:hypothetical protein n=1 Tax=Methylobacterium TaxID=407 RepID=UPI00272DF0C2|nr:hypothetical protein [Methylobacterium sp.]